MGGLGEGGVVHAPERAALALPARDLSSYVSRLVANRLATGGPIEDFESTSLRAVVLLTDIAGFTADVERVSSAHPGGLDELARAFSTYFADLVGLVYGHGGDVLGIAGDAFFSYWPAETDAELADATMRAAQAGLAIQAGLDNRSAEAVHTFRTRAGISAGDLRVGFVGGVGGRWELMPVGSPLGDVARAEKAARPGTVALAAPAWELVAARCESRPMADDLFELTAVTDPVAPMPAESLTAPDPPADLLNPFVPLPVRQRRYIPDTEWLQEKRRVTVVMANVSGGDALDTDLELRHAGVRAFQRLTARFEGASKVMVDNKGVTLSAVFGLPPRAHPDDARRAVTAAETMRKELDDLGLQSTIGVATGRAFCGVFGSDLRREYTLHGEVVNLAARLMEASDGEILCGDATYRATRDSLAFDALDPITLKGHPDPVPVHRSRGLRQTAHRGASALVGRDAERAVIEARLDELLRSGRCATVVVEGDAGLGKSRLVAEAARLAGARGLRVLTAAADPVESATSWYAWRSTFADLLGMKLDAGDGSAGQGALDVPCDPELRPLLPLLSSVVPVGIPENDLTTAMPGDARAENTKLLLASILRQATAATPALLIAEDAHWLDSNSWALLLEVAESVPRLMVAVTTRPMTDPPAQYGRLLADRSTHVVRLESLSPREIRTLAQQRLGVDELPPELAGFIDDRVAGHPFFCEELVQTMREGGIVRVEDGSVHVGDLDGVDVPGTIEGAVLSRFDRLGAGELLCLKVAAVIGRSFQSRTVSQTLPVEQERPSVPEYLAALARIDLTTREPAATELAYLFRHEITRDVAYELLTLPQRQQLHRAVAEWHERTYSDDELAPHAALLAHHWARANDPEKAVTYLERAGRQALRSGAFREALLFLTDAIEVEGARPDPIRRALCDKGIGTAHYFLGDFARSRERLESAVARLDRPVPTMRSGVARGLAGALGTQVAHLARPGRYRGRRAAEKELIDEALDCYKILGQIGYLDGEPTSQVLYLTLAGLNLGEEAGPSPHFARMLIHAATMSSIVGMTAQSDRYAARAIEMVDAGGQFEASAYVWNIWAVIAAHRGEWAAAEERNSTALERLGQVGDFNLEAEAWQTRSAIYICSGAFDAAEAAWTRHRELARRKGNPQNMCWSLLDEAETRVGRDEVAAAASALDMALAIPTAPNDGSSTIEKAYATALVRAAQGRWDDAVHAADTVVGIVAQRPPSAFHYVDFCAGAVRVYFDALEHGAGDRDALRRKATRGCKVVRRISRQFGNVRSRRWLLQGLLDWEHSRADDAHAAWRRAAATAERMDMPFELARARYEIARHGGSGADRTALLTGAAETFERLGARQMLRRVREAEEAG